MFNLCLRMRRRDGSWQIWVTQQNRIARELLQTSPELLVAREAQRLTVGMQMHTRIVANPPSSWRHFSPFSKHFDASGVEHLQVHGRLGQTFTLVKQRTNGDSISSRGDSSVPGRDRSRFVDRHPTCIISGSYSSTDRLHDV